VVGAYELGGQVQRVPADAGHGGVAIHHESVAAFHPEGELGIAHIVQGEMPVKQADERPYRRRSIVVFGFAQQQGAAVMLLSEYGIEAVQQSISINRVLREQGLLQVRRSLSWELLDPGASAAFAVVDHQIAHVYVRQPEDIARVKALLLRQPGIEQVLDKREQQACQLDHPRSGELVAVAAAGFWFDYYYWFDDRKAPDFARTVDIHRKPGYDPLELFIDPAIRFPKLRVARRLLQKKLGFRYYMDLIPLDTSLIRGSHGRLPSHPEVGPLLITDCDLPLPEHLPATAVKHLLLEHFLGRPYDDTAQAKEIPCGEPSL